MALWTVVGWVHTGFRRRSRLESHGTWAQRRAMSRAHVGVLLLVWRLLVVRIWAHLIPRTHVMLFNHAMLGKKKNNLGILISIPIHQSVLPASRYKFNRPNISRPHTHTHTQ